MMRKEPTLADWGYPSEGIIETCWNGDPDRCQELPQEALSPHTCASCRKFNKDWVCALTGEEKDPDNDTCPDIDYEEKWLDCSYGFRSPVRCEYSSDEAYKQACEAITAINKGINDDYERDD